MKRKLLSLSSLLIGFLGFSQTVVYFKYDEAGNQRYRGPNINARKAPEELKKEALPETPEKQATLQQSTVMDEKTFWKQIRLYPVPVNDVLTIDWTDEADELIESVSLYQHSTVHWKFQQQNIPSLNSHPLKILYRFDIAFYMLRYD